jgi:carbon storage regulator
MLVLTRRQGERIHVGDAIVVHVLEICGNKVRLGFEAPSNVRILRAELPRLRGIMSSEKLTVAVLRNN